jgi:NAD(P)-dependent dehydrogenase (short-subunit alcohol dehydrogenase family)
MRVRLKPLEDQVIVVTGASSGIGLATARMAVERGAKVVLVARNEPVIQRIAHDLGAERGRTLALAADVSRRDEVARVGQLAFDRFGRIDTWVNNAGVGIWGKVLDTSEEDARRLFDINFWGVVNGSLTAVRYLRRLGGALINVGSVSSDQASPMEGFYTASKHAVRGFTDALRMELEQERLPVSVTLIKPAAIGTPFHQHVQNLTRYEPALPSPLYAPEDVARTILHAASHPVRDLYVGGSAVVLAGIGARAPRFTDFIGRTVLARSHHRKEPAHHHAGNLYEPGVDGSVRGHHPGQWIRPSLYTRFRLARPSLPVLAAVALLGLGTWGFVRARTQARSSLRST